MPDALRLEVTDFTDLARWRWVLKDATGAFLADHEVRLDPAAERFEAFTALQYYVSWHAPPDSRTYAEARIVRSVGDWAATEVFGSAIAAALTARRPATVEVILPAGAEALAFLPLEAARIQGESLAAHDITLVIRPPAAPSSSTSKARGGDRLRVLGLFSLPEGENALNLRRERTELAGLIRGIAADIRVLQYGVTRDLLRDILQEAEGWDVIHISGHGAPGHLVLETADGHPDLINASDLADLLYAARDRVALVTLSACWSAGFATADQRRLLGLPVPGNQGNLYPERRGPAASSQPPAPGALATELADRLSCAVLAMRFPVGDEFAIALSAKLYDLLARQGQPLPRAVALTLQHLAEGEGVEGWPFPALSMAAPAIFGATAAGLTLRAPARTGSRPDKAENPKMAGFPPHPERFVGRTAVMARASAALAAESGVPGVLLHGMPGGGKTACALELAYTHEDAFQPLIWYKAPDEGLDITGALTDFALTLERKLPGFRMIHVLADDAKLDGFTPKLTELAERRRALIVIDNAESLLTDTGQWREARWGKVIAGLTARAGLGRVILTSRRAPAGTLNVQVEAVDALTVDEGLLLARELPNLRRLISGKLDGLDQSTAGKLALGVLDVAQGHPKLLELADGQAAHAEQLAELVRAGRQAWRDQGGLPDGFFATGKTTAAPHDYLQVLTAWTKSVADTVAQGERDLFWFLCCVEEPDRQRWIFGANWADLWQRLGRDGEPPDLDEALAAVSAASLITARFVTDGPYEIYLLHPGVAEAGRGHAGQPFRDAADIVVAGFWEAVHLSEYVQASGGSVDTGLLVRAGLAAVPYLLRRQQWDRAAALLEGAFVRDPSRANAAAVLPAIEQITRHEPRWAGVLGKVQAVTDPATAVVTLRAAMTDAATRGDYRAASANAGRLLDLCRNTGRLPEALDAAEKKVGYTRQAGLGPWDQLADEVWRLQVMASMGRADQVLDEVTRLRARMAALPATSRPGPGEGESPWHVREALLDTGRYAAMLTGRYAEALPLIAEVVASQRDRNAPAAVIARTQYNDYYPLLHLGRTEEALAVLQECRQAFQDARDTLMLGKTFSALADVEEARGHGDAAIRLERDGLRYAYLAGDAEGIAIGYHNLGNHLARPARPSAPAFASHLTSALICALIGNDDVAESVEAAATDLRGLGADDVPPADVADLRRRLGNIPGTDLPGLIERLSPDPRTAEEALRDLVKQAREFAERTRGVRGS